MTKQQFLTELRKRLSDMPPQDAEERLTFYSEMIDDRMEEGLSEEAAVDGMGTVDAVAVQILSDCPPSETNAERGKPKHRLKTWELVLLIVGSPIWVSLLIAALAVVFSLYVALWSVVISLWATAAVLAACLFYGVAMAVVYTLQGNLPTGLAALGIGLFSAGASILMFIAAFAASKGMVLLTKKMICGFRALFKGKEHSK